MYKLLSAPAVLALQVVVQLVLQMVQDFRELPVPQQEEVAVGTRPATKMVALAVLLEMETLEKQVILDYWQVVVVVVPDMREQVLPTGMPSHMKRMAGLAGLAYLELLLAYFIVF
jgi:hypothetical protein